jgi:Ca2+-binding RTX toxin-like protein
VRFGRIGVLGAAAVVVAVLLGSDASASRIIGTCAGKTATVVGTPDRDVYGPSGVHDYDVFRLRGGSDSIRIGDARNVTVCAGRGLDTIKAEHGVTHSLYFKGGRGNDLIAALGGCGASKAHFVMAGGPGADGLIGGGEHDVIRGGAGRDIELGRCGPDIIEGQGGNDHVLGAEGWDTIHGDAGNDLMIGGLGSDHLKGNSGRDTARGGPGPDFCSAEVDRRCEGER